MEKEDPNTSQRQEVVKSQAVVKYCNTQSVQQFISLECNTNLNTPPGNWMTTSTTDCSSLHQALFLKPYFASFHIAHQFPDSAGNVDVVSDAENMKKLLKLAYYKNGVVSMMAHKVGNTLLLDEFDISRFLVRNSAVEWSWLRKFVIDHIITLREHKNVIRLDERTKKASKLRNLQSKFLYRSLKYTQENKDELPKPIPRPMSALPGMQPVLPEPKVTENMPDPESKHKFNRNVLWTFEDIRMLIGTDMPIFGGPNRPCISLRLRDMSEPINVLTGIDYWLDNLMCNVPEVLMCYHLDGIVQKYEIIKTEDLPNLENSKFSPQVVRNVAQNILAFLKVNATKAGHTYWLFKGLNDDVVKLYDLTTLCQVDTAPKQKTKEPSAENRENPFTVPVGMLLYSVARNMKNCVERVTPKRGGTIRSLLQNCINLLPKEKYTQIVSSSHYILADLYMPVGIDPRHPIFDSFDDKDEWDDEYFNSTCDSNDDDDLNEGSHNLIYQTAGDLFKNGAKAATSVSATMKEFDEKAKDFLKAHTKNPTPLKDTIEERCIFALKHISAGLNSLKFFTGNEEGYLMESEGDAKQEEKTRILDEELMPNMTTSSEPISLPYESLQNDQQENKNRADKSRINVRNICKLLSYSAQLNLQIEQIRQTQRQKQQRVVANFNEQQFGSWNIHLRLLLLDKSCLTFATMAEYQYMGNSFGYALNYVHMAIRCQHVISKYMVNEGCHKGLLLARAGDCMFQLTKNWQQWDRFFHDYHNHLEEAKYIMEHIAVDFDNEIENNLILMPVNNMEEMMRICIKYYELALQICSSQKEHDPATRNDILRRLGNAENEAGLKYMFWAQENHRILIERKEQREAQGISIDINDPVDVNTVPTYSSMSFKCHFYLSSSIKSFETCGDKVNLAFLHCNMGRYWRFRAHLVDHKNVETTSVMLMELKELYANAFKSYENAFEILESRNMNPTLWDLVNWELSTATFQLAKEIQDTPVPIAEHTAADAGKFMIDLLQNSLKLCQQAHPDSRQPMYIYRSGMIHKRIAAHHYQSLRKSLNHQQLKTILTLCFSHYEKAYKILERIHEHAELITVQLDRICVYEYLAKNAPNVAKKVKYLHEALDVTFLVPNLLKNILEAVDKETKREKSGNSYKLPNEPKEIKNQLLRIDFAKYLDHYVESVHFLLKSLLKEKLSAKKSGKTVNFFKEMYMKALKDLGTPKSANNIKYDTIDDIVEYTKNIVKLMQAIKEIFEKDRAQNRAN